MHIKFSSKVLATDGADFEMVGMSDEWVWCECAALQLANFILIRCKFENWNLIGNLESDWVIFVGILLAWEWMNEEKVRDVMCKCELVKQWMLVFCRLTNYCLIKRRRINKVEML